MALSAPTGVAVTETLGACALTWNTVTGADWYDVYRKITGAADGTYVKVGTTTALAFTEEGVPTTDQATQAALLWTYGVIARNDDPDESTYGTVNATMPTITQTDIDNSAIAHPSYEIGAGWVTASESAITKDTTDTTSATGGPDSWLHNAIQRAWP